MFMTEAIEGGAKVDRRWCLTSAVTFPVHSDPADPSSPCCGCSREVSESWYHHAQHNLLVHMLLEIHSFTNNYYLFKYMPFRFPGLAFFYFT
jgi:hypothetical protein